MGSWWLNLGRDEFSKRASAEADRMRSAQYAEDARRFERAAAYAENQAKSQQQSARRGRARNR
jgi:hypothetical protein